MRFHAVGGHLLLPAQLLAFWPVWVWYSRRLRDGDDEIWGLFSLCAALVFYVINKPAHDRGERAGRLPIALTFSYAFLYPFIPPLARAILAVSAVGATLVGRLRSASPGFQIAGLLLLSLPIIPSLQFYAGYPLRILTGAGAAILLRIAGFPVIREGTALTWGGTSVWVDAPCSGVRMLWAGLFFSLILTCIYRLGIPRTMAVMGLSVVFVAFGNVLRSTGLFILESSAGMVPGWLHEGTGAAGFMVVGGLLVWCARRFRSEGR